MEAVPSSESIADSQVCQQLQEDGMWDACTCGVSKEDAWQTCAAPGGFCDRQIRGLQDVSNGLTDLADVRERTKAVYQETCSFFRIA